MRRSCREGKRGLQLLLMLEAPPCGWFGEVRPEAMPSSSPAKESVSTAREVRSLSLDGPGEENNIKVSPDRKIHTAFIISLYVIEKLKSI